MITDNTKAIFRNASKATESFVREAISVFPKLNTKRVLTADLSANDIKLINWAKKHGITTPTEIRETVGASFNKKAPPTNKEIEGVIKGLITKPTGKFKKS